MIAVPFSPGRSVQPLQVFSKRADESVTSSATLQDDDHLTGMLLEAGDAYALDGHLVFDATSDGPGIRLALEISANPADTCWFTLIGLDSTIPPTVVNSNLFIGTGSTASGTLSTGNFNDANQPQFSLSGIVFAPSGADGTLKLRWAQHVSSATTLTLMRGSWIRLMRLG